MKRIDLGRQTQCLAKLILVEGWLNHVYRPAEHRVERRGETLTTARAAGTPPRLVRSNALFSGPSENAEQGLQPEDTVKLRKWFIGFQQGDGLLLGKLTSTIAVQQPEAA